jgi:hypothetical protein
METQENYAPSVMLNFKFLLLVYYGAIEIYSLHQISHILMWFASEFGYGIRAG